MKTLWTAWPSWLKLGMAGAFVFLLACVGTLWTGDVDDLPSWLEGLATVAALLAAIVAARHTATLLAHEGVREKRLEDDRRRAQAETVAAWPTGYEMQVDGEDRYTGEVKVGTGIAGVYLALQNASYVPVTMVSVDATLVIDQKTDHLIRVPLGGNKQVQRLLEPASKPVSRLLLTDEVIDVEAYRAGGVELDYWCELTLSFRDAAGRQWERQPDGQLRPIGQD